MLTKNFYNAVLTYLTRKDVANGYTFTDGTTGTATGANAARDYLWNKMNNLMIGTPSTAWTSAGVFIGSGTTPATVHDYTLETPITGGCDITRGSVVVTSEAEFSAAYASYTITNTGETAMSISEIGLFAAFESSSGKNTLADRTVLEEPIIINPGETKPLTYTIRMNYPTA